MQDINDQLMIFVSNYYFYLQSVRDGGHEIPKHADICSTIVALKYCIELQCYRMVDGVFCVVFDEETKSDITPVIHVTKTNFKPLLTVFKAEGFTKLKFMLQNDNTDGDDDWLIELQKDVESEKVNFTQFSISGPLSGTVSIDNYVTSCIHDPELQYHWICLRCQMLIKVNRQAKIFCACGIATPPDGGPQCLKCMLNAKKTILQTANADFVIHSTAYQHFAKAEFVVPTKTLTKTERLSVCCVDKSFSKSAEVEHLELVLEIPQHCVLEAKLNSMSEETVKDVSIDDLELLKSRQSIGSRSVQSGYDSVSDNFGDCNSLLEDTLPHPTRPVPATSLTILVIGKSENNNSAFLDTIYRGKLIELKQITSNVSQNELGQKTDHGYIIDYGLYKVRYINLITDDSPIEWTLYPEIHGFIFIINEHYPYYFQLEMQTMMGMLPKSAVKNCCIVNIKESLTADTFSKYVDNFCKKHLLDDVRHFGIDGDGIKHQQEYNEEVLDTIKINIEEFILAIAESPITNHELKLAEYYMRLGRNVILYEKSVSTQEVKRLMATVTNATMSDMTRKFGRYHNTAEPLSDDEWQDAVHWNLDEEVLEVIRLIKRYVRAGVSLKCDKEITALQSASNNIPQNVASGSANIVSKIGSKFTGFFKRDITPRDYPSSEPYEGPINTTCRIPDVDDMPLPTYVAVYHIGRSDEISLCSVAGQSTPSISSRVSGSSKKNTINRDYPASKPFEGPVESIHRMYDADRIPLDVHVSVYHSGYSEDVTATHVKTPEPKREHGRFWALKSKIGFFKKATDYPSSKLSEGHVDTIHRTADVDDIPIVTYVSVYHRGRSDEALIVPVTEESTSSLGSKMTELFEDGTAYQDYPISDPFKGPVGTTDRTYDIDGTPIDNHITVYHCGRSDEILSVKESTLSVHSEPYKDPDRTDHIGTDSTSGLHGIYPVSPTLRSPKADVPSYNVLILGSSALNKQLLLNTFDCVRRHGTYDDAIGNDKAIAFQDSKDVLIDYGFYTIRYISKDALNTEQFDIHGILIVVENNTPELSNATDNYIRETFSRLPKRAVKNCCVVNTFNATQSFKTESGRG